ncbi:MAG: hypothetical protein ACOX6Q_01210 [Candidatus Dojkabacteria bacterium]|jgi:hypothetical protein
MAKEKPKQYKDALGSIYDFIFAETKKHPAKVKPVKVTGIDGTSEFADALVATLENPLLFVNKSTMDAFEDVVNYDLLSVKYGEGKRNKVKLNAKDIPKALKDPTGFLDKTFTKYEANRKVNKAFWAGDEIQALLGSMWAKKHGLDKETVLAMSNLHGAFDRLKQIENFDSAKAISTEERIEQLIDKHLIDPNKSYTLADFIERYGSEEEAKKKFGEYKNWIEKAKDTKEKKSLLYDKNVYVFVEGQEIRDKAVEAESAGDMLKAQNYYLSRRYIDSSLTNEQRKTSERKNSMEIRRYKDEVNRLKNSNDPNKKEKIKALEKEIKLMYANRSMSGSMRAAAFAGRMDGFWSSLKGTGQIQAGDLFITGNFFNRSNKHWFNPVDYGASRTLSEGGVRGFNKININGADINFKIAKTSRSQYAQRFNERLLKFYYRIPLVRVKSLMNGELYAYQVYENMNKFQNKFGNSIQGFDMTRLYNDKGKINDAYMESVLSILSQEQAQALIEFIKKNERLSNLAYRFNTIQRWQNKVSMYFDSKIGRKSREQIANLLIQSDAFKKFAGEILKEWVEKGGMQLLGKAINRVIGSVVGGPLGNIVGNIATGTATRVATKLAEPTMKAVTKTLAFVSVGVLLVMVLFFKFIFGSSAFLSVNSHISPVEVVTCEGFSIFDSGRGDFFFEDLDADVPIFSGSIEEIYDQVAASMGLGTKLELVTCPGHRMCASIDWAWCYSADKIYCKGDKLAKQSNVTLSKLFTHELLHQVQGRNGGGAPSVVREWGADLLSGNGGHYKFMVDGQCVTATSTKSYFLSRGCSEGELADLARNVGGAVSSACGSMVASSIRFCR